MTKLGKDALLHASAIPITPGATTLDPNGIQLYEWSHPLKQHDDCCGETSESRYSCCPCYVLAQIESRIGIASHSSAIMTYWILLAVSCVLSFFMPWYVLYWSDLNGVRIALCVAVMLAISIAAGWWMMRRIASARTKVRERFQIPGTVQEDRKLAFSQGTRMMRQMVRHLKIEDAGTFERVDTLPAYMH